MTGPGRGLAVPGNDWTVLDGARPDPAPRVSVIVPHFEQPDDLRRTLHALREQTYPRNLVEIVVVDDGSTEPPVVPDDVVLVVQPDEGFRLAAARNRGADAATGDVLCFLDADCAPDPRYLAELTRLPALASDAVTVGRRRHADLAALPHDAPLDALPTELLFEDPSWLANAYARSGDLLRADARSYRYLIGAVLACSADFFRETGGFDESFTAYGGEDWEWAWRCWTHGAVLAHVPSAVAWHNGPDAAARDRDPAAVNDETRRLEGHIPIAGSRPHALRLAVTDVAVRVDASVGATRAIITVDSLLRHLPTAAVFVSGDAEEAAAIVAALADPRVLAGEPSIDVPSSIDVHAPVRIATDAPLRTLVDEPGVGAAGAIRIADDVGPLLTLSSARVSARTRRWGTDVWSERTVPAAGIARRLTEPEPSLAAYYGDWD